MISKIKRLIQFAYFRSWSCGLWTPPDRKFLTTKVLSYFAQQTFIKQILFVGTQYYTRRYARYFPRQNFVTLDRDPSMARFGAKDHRIEDLTKFSESGYDLVFLNGVVGFGVNSMSEIRRAFERVRQSLAPQGWLVLGTSGGLYNESLHSILLQGFTLADFPPTGKWLHRFRFPFSAQVHEYRFFRLKEDEVSHANAK